MGSLATFNSSLWISSSYCKHVVNIFSTQIGNFLLLYYDNNNNNNNNNNNDDDDNNDNDDDNDNDNDKINDNDNDDDNGNDNNKLMICRSSTACRVHNMVKFATLHLRPINTN